MVDNLGALVFVRDPHHGDWGVSLPVSGGGAAALLGWRLRAAPVDAGEGFEPIARLLASILCACFSLTFLAEGNAPAEEDWVQIGGASIRAIERSRLASALRLGRKEPPLALMSTAVPEVASRLFHPDLWHMEAQTVLLSVPGSLPPRLGKLDLRRFLRREISLADLPVIHGSCGLMIPGHDGDWAIFTFLRREFREELARSLAYECERSGKRCEQVPAREFLAKLRPEGL